MSRRLFRFRGERRTSLGSIIEEDFSVSEGLNFSVGSIEVIGIGHGSGLSSGTFSGTLGLGRVGDIF